LEYDFVLGVMEGGEGEEGRDEAAVF